jgi:hypothetical protein
VFIKGSYTGMTTTSGSEHAEQKLLAALSRCVHQAFDKTVPLSGCKMACSVCKDVISAAGTMLSLRRLEEISFPESNCLPERVWASLLPEVG